MIFIYAKKLPFVFFLTIGLLSLSMVTGNPSLRLVNGTDRCSGRVEVLHEGRWGTVCDDEWDIRDAQVVCRAMDCGSALTAKHGAVLGQGQGVIWLDDVNCVGNETSLLYCRHRTLGENNCDHGEDAGVVCSATIRLINGTDQCSGRVEVHHGGRWSAAYNVEWGMNEAAVVCREMNCGDPVKVAGSFGQGGALRGYKISCSGGESSLTQCKLTEYVRTSHDHFEEASVECSGNVRLADGHSRCAGRVEFYEKGQWGTVCGESWDETDAAVVCRQLDCGKVHKITTTAEYGHDTGRTWIDHIECNGLESTLTLCPQKTFVGKTCNNNSVAGVVCEGGLEVRLANGEDGCSGRVEVRHGEVWQTVCDADWTLSKAEVVCEQLECGHAVNASGGAHFGQGSGLVVEASDSCFDNVTSLQQCSLKGFRRATCGHEQDAGARCAVQLRLVGGLGKCSGRVEILYKGQWGTVCDDQWEMTNADVVCRQLGCGRAASAPTSAHFGKGTGPIWLDDIKCMGQESALIQCTHPTLGENNCGHGKDAGVVCSATIRLIDGTDQCSGRVEVHHGGRWSAAYNVEWGMNEAAVICREMNCGDPVKVSGSFGQGGALRGYKISCSGGESSLTQCKLTEYVRTSHDHVEEASVECSGNPSLRLVNGTDRCSGRVEVLHDGRWGTVCDDEWDIRDAQVVCRAMDCGSALTAKHGAVLGQGQGVIWLDDVNCVGNETSLLYCRHRTLGENNCDHDEDAGVVCSATIRLINGTDQCSGRVEVHHGGRWSAAYNVEWGMNEAAVICREMNCGDPVKVAGSFGQGGALRGYKISCSGGESSLTQCKLTEYVRTSHDHVEEASVECSGNVRLADGHSRCAGRVEFYEKGQWGTVCGESWDETDAAVVCRQLDCGKVHKITTTAEYGHGTGRTWIDHIECNGLESTLTLCPQKTFVGKTCNNNSVAGVVCEGGLEVRLANGEDECSGRVEVRHGEVWQTVCDADWTLSKAEVVCEQLECGHAVNASGGAHFGQGSGLVVEASDSCFDSVTSLQQCSLKGFRRATCGHEQDAGARCAVQLRLVGSLGKCSGRVEILYKGQWGTVCDDQWEMTNADVVCRQLGCGRAASAPTSAHFDRGTGPIWLDDVKCTGQESALIQCTHPTLGENNCGHDEDAGVFCLDALQKTQISLSPAAVVNSGDRVEITCSVVTEHLGGTFILRKSQGSFKMEKHSEREAVTFTFPTVDFHQNGSYFCEYKKQLPNQIIHYPQGNTAELSVTVKLEMPNINLISRHAMASYSPDKILVTQGSNFAVTCSVHSRYPGGFFYLTESNTSTTEAKPALGHSSAFYQAHFEFPAIDYKHQGEYNCVYGVNISTVSFLSVPSKSLKFSVVSKI